MKNFYGAVLIDPRTKKRFLLREVTSPAIYVTDEQTGHRYYLRTINGDPISNGRLFFEDPELTEQFKAAYAAYCRSEDAYWEEYGYWMRRA